MSFRTKNDIGYFKFLELSERIEGHEEDARFVLEESYKIFKPKSLNKFSAALERNGRLKRKFKLDLDFKQAGRFIDADTYRGDGDVLNMLKSLLVPKRRFLIIGSRYKVENISLREAEHVLKEWEAYLSDVKSRYEYIYNPPQRINTAPETQGSLERAAFAEHYGGYAEMSYLISNGLIKDMRNIWSYDLDFFLFWGEYLLRKRDVENIK